MRSLATALEAYYIDNNAYPPWSTGEKGENGSLKPSHESYHMPTFRTYDGENDKYASLSTPISYITSFPRDPLTPGGKSHASYVYYTGALLHTTATAWILISAGPDRYYDINPFEDFFPDTLPTSPAL
ncbi:MAG: hypothetical protein NTX50_02870 [Candidatus Sumerlaeota bacterium]|nr:hypothetical protein [Candidatus Sumerlaeota bacterium]